jgi:UPF0755 protein
MALAALALIVIVGSALFSLVQGTQGSESASKSEVLFVVRNGDTPSSVGQRLQSTGVIHGVLYFSGTELFSLAARMNGLASRLQPGTFELRRNMSIDTIISTLKGLPQLATFTVIPGDRAEQVAEDLTRDGLRGHSFLHAVRHPVPLLTKGMHIGWPHPHTLEGFLYPDTYTVEPQSSGRYLAAVMVKRFSQLFTHHMRKVAKREGHTLYQIVTMASIIQREDFIPSQKRLISSVYWNRLNLPAGADGNVGDLLQSDPTVSYALGHKGNWWPALPTDRSTIISPYNTFLHLGLPPGPIAEPDIGSLRAALHPAKTTYLYFATKPGDTSGHLYFASTYQQFECILQAC